MPLIKIVKGKVKDMGIEEIGATNSIYNSSPGSSTSAANVPSNNLNLLFEPAPKKKTTGIEIKPSSSTSAKLCKQWGVFFKNAGKDPMPQNFFNKVEKAAKQINCPMEDLLAIIYMESAFDTKAKKVDSSGNTHCGLIQMDKTAFELAKGEGDKTSFSTYRNAKYPMQLDYGAKYLLFRKNEKNLKGKMSGGQVRILILKPKYISDRKAIAKAQKIINGIKDDVKKANNKK